MSEDQTAPVDEQDVNLKIEETIPDPPIPPNKSESISIKQSSRPPSESQPSEPSAKELDESPPNTEPDPTPPDSPPESAAEPAAVHLLKADAPSSQSEETGQEEETSDPTEETSDPTEEKDENGVPIAVGVAEKEKKKKKKKKKKRKKAIAAVAAVLPQPGFEEDEKKDEKDGSVMLKTIESNISESRQVISNARTSFLGVESIPPVACIRCSNSYFITYKDGRFIADAKNRHLTNCFSFVARDKGSNRYILLHLDSCSYVATQRIQISETDIEYELRLMEHEEALSVPKSKYTFGVIMTSCDRHIAAKFVYDDQLLTFRDGELRLEPIIDPAMDDASIQTFELIKPLGTNDNDEDLENIVWRLNLVNEPIKDKIGMDNVERPAFMPDGVFKTILSVFTRLDEKGSGYAPFKETWSNVLEYTEGNIPSLVSSKISQSTLGTSSRKLIHAQDLIATIEFVWDYLKDEIIIQQQLENEEQEKGATEDITIRLRRLDPSILTEHPFCEEWRNMGWWQRKWYDYKNVWYRRINGNKTKGFGFWRNHLVKIQGNFGESIFAFFQFTRWLLVLNLLMGVLWLFVIIPHAFSFSFSAYSLTDYLNMALGNEDQESWYFYGAYKDEYDGFLITDWKVDMLWILVSGFSLVLCVSAILKKVLGSSLESDEDNDYTFSRNVLSTYDFGISHKDDITLQQNSIMIRLHETLLAQLDAAYSHLTCVIFLKRVIGAMITIIICIISGVALTSLIVYEDDYILPKAESFSTVSAKISVYIVPAAVTFIKKVAPAIIRLVVKFEHHTAAIAFQQEFFRVYVLRMFIIMVTLFQTSRQAADNEEIEGESTAESAVGMILFRFLVFDIVVEIGSFIVKPGLKYCCGRCCGRIKEPTDAAALIADINARESAIMEKQTTKKTFDLAGDSWKEEFDIPQALLDVMYRQAIVWSGMVFSPMIPWLAVGCTVVTFYIRKRFLFNYCRRPNRALGVVKQLKFFYSMLLLGMLVSFIPFQWFLSRIPVAGPHANKQILTEFSKDFTSVTPVWLDEIFKFCLNGVILLPLLVVSIVYLFYLRRTRTKFQSRSKLLKESLMKEISEKKQIMVDYHIHL